MSCWDVFEILVFAWNEPSAPVGKKRSIDQGKLYSGKCAVFPITVTVTSSRGSEKKCPQNRPRILQENSKNPENNATRIKGDLNPCWCLDSCVLVRLIDWLIDWLHFYRTTYRVSTAACPAERLPLNQQKTAPNSARNLNLPEFWHAIRRDSTEAFQFN